MIPVFKQVAVWPIVLVLFGCAGYGGTAQREPTRTAAILGVTVMPGAESGRSQGTITRELEALMLADSTYRIMRSDDVSKAVSAATPGAFDAVLGNYAKSGYVKGYDLKALQGAQLPVQTALIARIEKNQVVNGEPKRIELRNNVGDVLTDRERVILSTVREMQIQASMINIANGRVIWNKTYRATPASKSSYVHYSGSSFSGSLAASFVNTMSNGIKVPSGPAPPSSLLTVRSLLREIVRNLPG